MSEDKVNTITNLGTWIKDMISTKQGSWVIGLFMGLAIMWFPYNEKYKIKCNEVYEKDKIILLKDNTISILNNKLLEAENNKLEYASSIIKYMKELNEYFIDTKDIVSKIEKDVSKNADDQKLIIHKALNDEE